MNDLQGKTAIISGGAEGIGYGIAQVLGRNGMNIVLADINAELLEKAEQGLQQLGVPVLALPLDVVDTAQWQTVTQKSVDRFGKIHMLVNNAGVGGTPSPVGTGREKDWRWIVDVNLMGVVNGAEAVIPLMKEHGEGAWLVNVASMAGFMSLPMAAAYSATKAAVVAMSECWHGELKADKIHVSVVCPGFVKTRINLSQRNRQAQYQTDAGQSTNSKLAAENNEIMQKVIDGGTSPLLIGERVLEALEAKELYIITHPNFRPAIQARFAGIDAAFKRAASSELLSEITEQALPDLT